MDCYDSGKILMIVDHQALASRALEAGEEVLLKKVSLGPSLDEIDNVPSAA